MSLYLCLNLNASFRNFKDKVHIILLVFVNSWIINIMLAKHFSYLVKILWW